MIEVMFLFGKLNRPKRYKTISWKVLHVLFMIRLIERDKCLIWSTGFVHSCTFCSERAQLLNNTLFLTLTATADKKCNSECLRMNVCSCILSHSFTLWERRKQRLCQKDWIKQLSPVWWITFNMNGSFSAPVR